MDKVKAWLDYRGGDPLQPPRSWYLLTWSNVGVCAVFIVMLAWMAAVSPQSGASAALTVVAASVLGASAGFTVANMLQHRAWLRIKNEMDKLEKDFAALSEYAVGSRRYRKRLEDLG